MAFRHLCSPGRRLRRIRLRRTASGTRARLTPPSLLRRSGARLIAAVGIALAGALGDAGRLAAPAAEVIELGAAHPTTAHHLDRVDHRRIEREHALDSLAIGNLPDREILVEPVPGTADAHALIGLHAGTLALDHLDVDHHGIARREIGNLLAGGQFLDLLLLELLDQVHGNSPSAAPRGRRRSLLHPCGFAPAYTTCGRACHPGFIKKMSDSRHPARSPDVQSVIAIARSARRSRADSFSLALLSWPQAARMSRPRGVRTGDA